jgi:3'-phosphoadenosine 5'-phosphosulfate sulfotransferase (PAPS reductase)/FAD synthetase
VTTALPQFSASQAVATTPEVDDLLAADAPVAIGVSGGKDSTAVALATVAHLDAIGHTGPRLLIHSDLGMTEWSASGPMCQRVANYLGVELLTVRRAKGGMMERWEQRWADNKARYASLSCVQLILPWSTPSMRFCTSELKTAPICDALSRRWPGRRMVSVTGIRRQESRGRAKAPVAKAEPKLDSITRRTSGVTWNPIIEWTIDNVLAIARRHGLPRHEAYERYGASRVSCAFCIMSRRDDLIAASRCAEHADLYRRMVTLEINSSFAFQGGNWLGDVAPELLAPVDRFGLGMAKENARQRERYESRLPRHLLYTKGWPTCIPSEIEASLLSCVRQSVAQIIGLKIDFRHPSEIVSRYRDLMAAKRAARRAVIA